MKTKVLFLFISAILISKVSISQFQPAIVQDWVNLILNLQEKENIKVQLFNSMGARVIEATFDNRIGAVKESLSVENFAKGVYLINVQTKKLSHSKVVIIK